MNILCEFLEDWFKILLCRVHTVKSKVGPLVATNITKWLQKCLEYGPIKNWCI